MKRRSDQGRKREGLRGQLRQGEERQSSQEQMQVEDEIPTEDASTLIIAKGLKMLSSNRLDKKSRATMELSMRQHHRLGHTFP